jgi:hypothetical protein
MGRLIKPISHIHFSSIFSNFALANRNLPAIIWCFAGQTGWRVRSRIDVSVSAVRHHAFVFAAPPHFVAGIHPTQCRGAVSVGVVSSARGAVSKKFLPSL